MLDKFKGHPELLVKEIATGARVIAERAPGGQAPWDSGPGWLGGRALHDAAQAFCDVIPFFEAELKVSANGSSDLPRPMLTEQVAELAIQIRSIFHDPRVSLPLAFYFAHYLLQQCGYWPVENPSSTFIRPDQMSNPEFSRLYTAFARNLSQDAGRREELRKLIHERWRRDRSAGAGMRPGAQA
jgi:hypothetical protein